MNGTNNVQADVLTNTLFLLWIHSVIPVNTRFSARELLDLGRGDPDAPAPHGCTWATLTPQSLSRIMGRLGSRHDGGLHLCGVGTAHGRRAYRLMRCDDVHQPPSEPMSPTDIVQMRAVLNNIRQLLGTDPRLSEAKRQLAETNRRLSAETRRAEEAEARLHAINDALSA
jgi:hypothetical protein